MSNKFLIRELPGQLHGEVKTLQVTVSGGPTLVPPVKLSGRKDFILQNGSGGDIWVGGADVTSSNGIKVEDAGVFAAQIGRADVYAVTSGATVSGIVVMEIS